ncbi:hypothetical protein BDK61_2038 [Haloarcula quadrata]|jgi:hypothetical protein|uniref:Low-salt glycan biosynthesis hexosyltransferase Agl6 C-terminal transmembrane region domain-containing protein n=1 Tax=Haloarcula quadrata TaxID=182779 RepID=A0A495R5X4_9EURY|nr:hypothetical protein [Haloarcula quadrata]RKS82725.1 hypothetical protein BDK61_2038 [Haloarcula quadrata]
MASVCGALRFSKAITVIIAAAVCILYLAVMFGQWLLAGEEALPSATATLLASTVVVLGLQTVFGSLFMSMLADNS